MNFITGYTQKRHYKTSVFVDKRKHGCVQLQKSNIKSMKHSFCVQCQIFDKSDNFDNNV